MWIIHRLKKVTLCYIAILLSVIALTSMYLPKPENTACLRALNDSFSSSAISQALQSFALKEQKGSRGNYSLPDAESLVTLYGSHVNNTVCSEDISKCHRYSLNDSESYQVFLKRFDDAMKRGSYLKAFVNSTGTTSSQRFHRGINQYYLYHPDDAHMVNDLLKDLTSQLVVSSEEFNGGNQIKMVLTFADGSQALFKPMKFSRETEDFPNHFYYEGFERPTSEIAAFHLDRILGFYRVPPTAGRVLNLTHDVLLLNKNKDLHRRFYKSPEGNQCYQGTFDQYCSDGFPVCGSPELIEGSAAAFLPNPIISEWRGVENPYKNTASLKGIVPWDGDPGYCDTHLKSRSPNSPHWISLPNLIDMSVLDFIMGHMDRHHFYVFDEFGNDTFSIHLDHGRGFRNAQRDPKSSLAAVQQCCVIRFSTLAKLIKLYRGPESLSQVLRAALTSDPLAPILSEPHLSAVDRRVAKILKAVGECLAEGRSWESVVIDDDINTRRKT